MCTLNIYALCCNTNKVDFVCYIKVYDFYLNFYLNALYYLQCGQRVLLFSSSAYVLYILCMYLIHIFLLELIFFLIFMLTKS